MSQIFHSVSITIYLRRSEPCNFLLQICFSLKVEDLGHWVFFKRSSGGGEGSVGRKSAWRAKGNGVAGRRSGQPGRGTARRGGELRRNLQGACKWAAGNLKKRGLKKTIVPHSGRTLNSSTEFENSTADSIGELDPSCRLEN